jgi:hypothetical protein
MRRDEEEESNETDNSRASVGTTKSSRCSSVSTSLSEHSEVTGESLQEAKKRALKELETRFLRCKQRAKVTHERKKALATNENRMRETVLRHDAFVRERQNQHGRAEKAEQSERESAISLSKTIETCLHILRKTKDRTRFCERRTNRFAIAKVFLEKVLAEHGENKRGKEEEEEEEEDEEEAGRRETAAPPRDQSSSSLSSHHHHHHHDSVNFEDISDIIVRCNSLRAIHDTLTTRRSQARENVMLKASEHESTLATFRARRLDAERESVRQLLSELENARALSALEREKSKKKRDERVRASKIKSTIAKLYENVCEKSAVSRSIDAANERINNDKIENTNKHNREDVVALQLRQLSHFARDCKRILLLAN